MSDDLFAWLLDQASALRERRCSSLDYDNLAEELEAVALRHKHERFRILLGHLLKWVYQPTHRSNSWKPSIREAKIEIRDLLEDLPSLQKQPACTCGPGLPGMGASLRLTKPDWSWNAFPQIVPGRLNKK
jgi:hypothetical protein